MTGAERSYGPPRPRASTPKTFPRQTAVLPRHGDSAAAPPNQAKIWTARSSAQVTHSSGPGSPAGAPPAETPNTKPYHGCHARLLGTSLASPRLRRIIRRHQGFYTIPLGLSHWSVPATTGGSVEPHTHHRRPLHASALLAPRPHGGRMGERMAQDGLLSCNCQHEAHAQLPDPILQIFNSRLVGLGKCRMNQVSSQSGRMYKASRCPTPFWHESSLETSSGIVGFIFTSGFINQAPGNC